MVRLRTLFHLIVYIAKVEKYYEGEIRGVKRVLDTFDFDNEKVINGAIQRCLGVAFFAQEFDITFAEVDDLYEKARKELYALLKERD